jgi:HNH endonuclease
MQKVADEHPHARLSAALEPLRRFDPERRYYALTLIAHARGRIGWSAYSHFVGMSSKRVGWELREASLVDPSVMSGWWADLGHDWLVVEDRAALSVWIRVGGHALVDPELAREHLPMMVAAQETAPDGPIGFVRTASLRPTDWSRKGSRGVRRRVVKRDSHRCQRCGRGEPDVSLSRHHVYPHQFGGLSREKDLITLCADCHDFLHADAGRAIGFAYDQALPKLDCDDHDEGVRRYRRVMANLGSAI